LHDTKIKLSKTVIDLTVQKELEKKHLRELEWRGKIVKNLVVEHKKIDKQKTEFASMIAHDLKTPLTPIIGWCSILEEGMYGTLNEKQLKSIHKIKENAHIIDAMMGDLLDVRKMDLKQMAYNFSDINSCDLIQSVHEDYEQLMEKNKIEFVISCNENVTLYGDKNRIEQVLKNFLINAIDFVEENGKIEMYTKRKDPYITFYVKDDGVGIAKDKHKDLFKKFYQVKNSIIRKHGGSGLGLAICKGIVEGMNGIVGVQSELGKGSIFYFSLPIKKYVVADPNFSTRNLN
jgi:signal transduction histidine kinase